MAVGVEKKAVYMAHQLPSILALLSSRMHPHLQLRAGARGHVCSQLQGRTEEISEGADPREPILS